MTKEIKMDAELKRYRMRLNLYDSVEDEEDTEGCWVRFEDAKKIIEELESIIEKANNELSDSGVEWEAYRDREE
jgi:hypothetical protein